MRFGQNMMVAAAVAALGTSAWSMGSPINLATDPTVGATASQSSGYQGDTFPASNAIDGTINDFTHTDVSHDGNGNSADLTPSWTLDLHGTYAFSEIDIYNRGDSSGATGCCQYRLTDFSVTVYAANHSTVEFTQLYYPLSGNPSPELVISLPAGTSGEFVTIQKFNNPLNTTNPSPDGSDNVALSLGEVEILTPEPASLGLLGIGGLSLLARRRRA